MFGLNRIGYLCRSVRFFSICLNFYNILRKKSINSVFFFFFWGGHVMGDLVLSCLRWCVYVWGSVFFSNTLCMDVII